MESSAIALDNQDRRIDHRNAYSEYKSLFEQTRKFNESHDIDCVLEAVAHALKGILDFSAMAYLVKEHFSDDYYIRKDWYLNRKLEKQIFHLEHSGYVDLACESNSVLVYPENGGKNGTHPLLIVPLKTGARVVGALVVQPKIRPLQRSNIDSDLLALLGSQAALALENARLHEDMEVKHHATSSFEAFLEDTIESIPEGLFAVDLEKKFSLFNSSAADLLGVSREQALGSRYDEILSKEVVEFLDRAFNITYTTGEYENEISYSKSADEREIPLGVHTSILKDANEALIGAIAVCRNLSEHQELIHLRRLDKLKDEFLSSVSHELRTPLTGIKSFTEILRDYENHGPEARKGFLDIIVKQTDRLIELIDELLATSQLGSGEFIFEISTVDLNAVFAETLTPLQLMAAEKDISLEARFDKDNQLVQADSKRVAQVFINLIGNAIKFSPAGSTIKVWSEKGADEGLEHERDYLRIGVQDEGAGIPKDYRKTIFEKFTQVCDDPATKPDGSGLGLWISKQIIEELNGNIWVESGDPRGSIFFFTLPISC